MNFIQQRSNKKLSFFSIILLGFSLLASGCPKKQSTDTNSPSTTDPSTITPPTTPPTNTSPVTPTTCQSTQVAIQITNAAASNILFSYSTSDLTGLSNSEVISSGHQDLNLSVLSGPAVYSYNAKRTSDNVTVGSGTFQITCAETSAVTVLVSDAAAPLGTYPGPHKPLPRVLVSNPYNISVPPMDHPKLYSITFSNEDATYQNDIDTFTSRITTMPYMNTLTEYGFVSATTGTPIHLAQAATASMTMYGNIYSILDNAFSTHDSRFGSKLDQSVFIFYFPVGTTIDNANCTNAQASHYYYSTVTDPNPGTGDPGGQTINIPIIFVPRCSGPGPIDTYNTSHEIIEAISDPYPGYGYYFLDSVHNIFSTFGSGGNEIGDMCQSNVTAGSFVDSVYGYFMQRSWSNAAAAAGHHPCVSGGAYTPMQMAVPVFGETVTYKNTITNEGVKIPVGSSRTIELQLYSDQVVPDWNINVQEVGGSGHLSFSLDKTTGNNGSVLLLTITVLSKNTTYNSEIFRVYSDAAAGKGTMIYYGVVGN